MSIWIENNGGWAIGAALAVAGFSEGIIEWVARIC